jgi:hypothetical protein
MKDIEDTANSISGGLCSLRAMLLEAVEKVDQLSGRSCTLSRKLSPAVKASCLAVACLAVLSLSAAYPRPELNPMTAIHPTAATDILAGKMAMQRKDYADAVRHFQAAGCGGAFPESYLPPMIECYLETQQYGLALAACADLDNGSPRDQTLVPYFRGAANMGLGNRKVAISEYSNAKKLGCPRAAEALSFIRSK